MIREDIAHLTAPDGTRYQVLNEAGNDWDEVATKAAYDAGEAAKAPPKVTEATEKGA